MDRSEFIIVTTIVLFIAFALGWFAYWLLNRFTRVTQSDMSELDRMAQALHEAEETRDAAIWQLRQREDELKGKLNQAEAELSAAMEGLRAARQDAEYMRRRLEDAGSN